ncbi:MAG: hypothetical protein ACJ74D_06885 [Gaiellaceae bacterium]
MRVLAALLLIVGALSALGFARHEQRVREQDHLAAIASDLAGRTVAVRCPGFLSSLVRVRTEGGYVKFDANGNPEDNTVLSPETCKALRHPERADFACIDRGDCTFKEFKVGWALHTLAHESFHLRGVAEEAVAECYSLQNIAFVAERLGLDTATAGRVQKWVYLKGYPNEPDEYRSEECRDGGEFDLRPRSPEFP